MTWICTSINTRLPLGQSSSMFEVYLDKLDKDLQNLQDMATYINVQNQKGKKGTNSSLGIWNISIKMLSSTQRYLLAYLDLSKRGCDIHRLVICTTQICWHRDNRSIALFSKDWNRPMQNIAHRARTLNQWFENQQSKKFKDVLLSGKVVTDHNPGTRCLRIDIWQCVQISTPNRRVAQLLTVSKIQTTQRW